MPTKPLDPFAAYEASLEEPQRLRDAVSAQGTFGTPEATAKAYGLSEKTGISPSEVIKPDAFDVYNKSLEVASAGSMAGTKTGKWLLKDPLHVDLTGGKFDPFMALEAKHSSAEAARVDAENEKTGRSWITGMAASIGYGAANLAGSPMELVRTVANAAFSTDTANAITKAASYTPMGLIAEQNQKVAKWLETKKRATENIQFKDQSINWGAVNPTTLHGAENIVNMVASEAVPMLAQYVLGALAAPETGGVSLAATTAANAGKLQKVGMFAKAVVAYAKSPVSAVNAMRVVTGQAQQGVQELMGDGLTEDQAWQKVAPGALLAGLFSVAAGSPMEAKIMEDMFSKVASAPGANGVMRKITTRFASFISMGAKEGAQEVLEGIGEDLAAFITYQPDKTVKDFAANAIMNFVGGAAMGGVMGASLHGSQALQHARNADFIYALHDEKARMEFTKHAPGKMAEFVNDLTKDGSLMSLPVDANGFNRFYQSQGMTAEDARTFAVEKLGVVAADYDMALQNNGDLIIPTGNYAQHIAGNENFEGIFEVTRAAQGGPMMKELQEQHINEQDLQSMQKAMAEMPVTDPQRDMVRDEIAAMLKPATRVFTPAQVTDIADQFARVLTITAAKGKTTATELLAKNKLQIERQFESMETTKATNEGRTLSPLPETTLLNSMRGAEGATLHDHTAVARAGEIMKQMGLDPNTATVADVRAAIELAKEAEPGSEKHQGGTALKAIAESEAKATEEDAKEVAPVPGLHEDSDESNETLTKLFQSLASWTPAAKKEIADTNNKLGLVEPEKLAKWLEDVDSMARLVAENPNLDYEANPLYSALKENADKFYKESLDFSTLCRKRIEFQATMEAVAIEVWENEHRALTSDDLLEIRKLMVQDDREVGCGACYVDSARIKAFVYLKDMAAKYPEIGSKFFTMEGWDMLKAEQPAIYKEMRTQFGTMGGKGFESRTDYRGDILHKFMGKGGTKRVADYNRRSGLRWQSWSDFELHHAIDVMQAAVDSATVGLAGHAYTKVPEFVRLMGNTGLMINASLIPPLQGGGFNPDGTLAFDPKEGMPIETAVALREQFPSTVGTVIIAVSDAHIQALLDDPRIDYIIPYHSSGLGKAKQSKMDMAYKDYTAKQNDRDYVGGTKVTADERVIWAKFLADSGLESGAYDPKHGKVEWHEHDGDKSVYTKLAAERGLIPRFVEYLEHDNYMKLLTDKRMFDGEGNRIKQGPLRGDFDMTVVQELAKDYVKAPNVPYTPAVERFFGRDPEPHVTTDLTSEDGGVTRLNQPAYHGTPYRFDKFSLEHMGKGEGAQAFGYGLYFAGSKDVAEWYRNTTGARKTIDGVPASLVLPSHYAALQLEALGGDQAATARLFNLNIARYEKAGNQSAVERNKEALRVLESGEVPKIEHHTGQLYKVEIPEDSTMLLWDKPLSEQPEAVKKALLTAFPELSEKAKAESGEIDQLFEELTGKAVTPTSLTLPLMQASDFYHGVARKFGADKAASEAMNAAGISGIKYLAGTSRAAGEGDYNYVVFDDAAISIMETYYQQQTTGARGYLEFGTAATGEPRQFKLALLEAENKSTVFHELGHFYLELLGDMSEDARADQAIKDDYAAILKWFGVESRSQITTEMHEKFADGHLAYLLEGKAPTPELASSFTKFSKWLSKIGQQLLGVEVNMTDEVRGIFDRLYASEAEIEAAKKQSQLQMFTTAEQAGMSQAEFNVYKKAVQKEWETAQEKLTQQLMKELDREQQREYRDEFEKTRAQVDAEILARPEYAALKALSDGHLSDDPMNPTEVKLSRQALVEKYGEKLPGQLARDTNYVYATEGGMDADAAAMILGWNSGDELVQALTGLEGRNVVVDRLTKSRMEEAHPTLMGNPEALREQAITLLNGEQLERRLATELRSLQKLRSKAKPLVAQAVGELKAAEVEAKKDLVTPKVALLRASAKAFIEGKQAFTIRPDIFRADMLRAGKEAFKLLAKKDYAGASKAKEQELLSHFLYLEAVKAKDEADGFRTFVKRNDSATVRGKMGKAGGTFLAQFDDLRDRFSIEREPAKELARRESLATWAEKQGLESNDVVVADWLMDERQTLNYQELTLTQLRDLRDALKNIKHLAYLQLGTIIDGKHVAYEDMMEEFEDAFAKIPHDKTTLLRASDIRREAGKSKAGAMLQGFDATLVKIEQLVNWIDGNNVSGPAHKFIWDRIAKAQYADHKLSLELNGPLIAAMEAMPREQRESLSTETFDIGMVDGDGKPSPVSRAEILTMLLYNGQATRREKLLAGYASRGLNEKTMQAAFSHLKAEDFAFAKTIWATFDTMQPMILDLEERLTGIRPQWEQATPFEVYDDDGRFLAQLPGGYFPLVADYKLTGELGKKQEGGTVQQVMGGNGYSRASTSKGHTKELTGKTYPLLLDYHRTLTAELSNQIKDLTHREVVLSVNKILSNDRFSTLMKEHVGESYEKQLQPWLVNVVSDRNAGASRGLDEWNKFFAASRSNTVAAVLGFKFSSMIVQFADLSRIVAPGDYRVSVRHLTGAYADLLSNRSAAVEMIKELSPEMAQREENLDRDLRDRLNTLRGEHGLVAKWNRAAFSGLSMMDSIISWPVWLGSYQQSMANHGDQQQAAREADRTVRMLLMAGAPKDLTPLQADKNPFYKAITMFMGDATSNYNSLRNAGHNINGLKGIPTFTGAMIAVMIGAMFGDWLKGQWPEEDTGEWMARKAALGPLGTMPVVRDVANLYDNVLSGKPFTDYKFSPAFTSIQKVFVDPVIHTKKLYDGTEEIGDYAINMLESTGYALGVGGTAQAKGIIKFLKRYSEGTETADNPVQFTYDVLSGKKKEKR